MQGLEAHKSLQLKLAFEIWVFIHKNMQGTKLSHFQQPAT